MTSRRLMRSPRPRAGPECRSCYSCRQTGARPWVFKAGGPPPLFSPRSGPGVCWPRHARPVAIAPRAGRAAKTLGSGLMKVPIGSPILCGITCCNVQGIAMRSIRPGTSGSWVTERCEFAPNPTGYRSRQQVDRPPISAFGAASISLVQPASTRAEGWPRPGFPTPSQKPEAAGEAGATPGAFVCPGSLSPRPYGRYSPTVVLPVPLQPVSP